MIFNLNWIKKPGYRTHLPNLTQNTLPQCHTASDSDYWTSKLKLDRTDERQNWTWVLILLRFVKLESKLRSRERQAAQNRNYPQRRLRDGSATVVATGRQPIRLSSGKIPANFLCFLIYRNRYFFAPYTLESDILSFLKFSFVFWSIGTELARNCKMFFRFLIHRVEAVRSPLIWIPWNLLISDP